MESRCYLIDNNIIEIYIYICRCYFIMASKTISVTEKVYKLLKKTKLPSESFGDTIERLCLSFTAKNLIQWFDNSKGWEDMNDSEFNEYYCTIQEFQKNFKVEYGELL